MTSEPALDGPSGQHSACRLGGHGGGGLVDARVCRLPCHGACGAAMLCPRVYARKLLSALRCVWLLLALFTKKALFPSPTKKPPAMLLHRVIVTAIVVGFNCSTGVFLILGQLHTCVFLLLLFFLLFYLFIYFFLLSFFLSHLPPGAPACHYLRFL